MSDPADLDLELDRAQRATLSALLKGEEPIQPPEWLALEAAINDEIERARAADDPEDFWSEKARDVEWMEPWREVMVFDPPRHEWFVGGRLNATVSTLDRHVHGERRNKAALIWVGGGRRRADLHLQPPLP
jgi:acetyl-CoA synthetase